MTIDGTPARIGLLHHELTEIRGELRRIDAKARDLLVVATLAVTVAVACCGLLHSAPPPVAAGGFALAGLPWLISVIHLIVVIRPMLIRDHSPALPGNAPMDTWLMHRWQALNHIMVVKYRLVRRAVDLLLVMVGIGVVSAVLWVLS